MSKALKQAQQTGSSNSARNRGRPFFFGKPSAVDVIVIGVIVIDVIAIDVIVIDVIFINVIVIDAFDLKLTVIDVLPTGAVGVGVFALKSDAF